MRINKRAWVEINLDAISNNIKEIRRITNPNSKIMAVVKADAYGHGCLEVSRTLLENGADYLGVAFIDEAIQLRRYGITVPILILGHTPPEYASYLVSQNIIPSVFDFEIAHAVSEQAKIQGKTAKIHIKVDTGMGRVGFVYNNDMDKQTETIDSILKICALPNIEVEGIFTHFSTADEECSTYTKLQYKRFTELNSRLYSKNVDIRIKHACNSAGVIQFPEMHLDMVRPGMILYGMYPSDNVDKRKINLIPAMQFKAVITNIKEVPENTAISYGKTFVTKRKSIIATVPVGYADGYSRLLSDTEVLIGDKFAPVLGRICMDQCMIDVTNVNNIHVGDEVILFGGKKNLCIPVENLAKRMGTINYEVLCVIGKRIPRVYMQNGQVVEVLNYLLGNSFI